MKPADWYPDPSDATRLRWWDGESWTQTTVEASALATSPAPASTLVAPRRWRPGLLFWCIAPIVLLVALLGLGSGGIGSFMVILGLVGLGTAIFALATRRSSWATLPRSVAVRGAIAALSGVLILGGGAAYGATHPTKHPAQTVRAAPSTDAPVEPAAVTPSSTPTPEPVQLADYSQAQPVDARAALVASGMTVVMSTADGSAPPSDWTGWTIVSETPAAGQRVPVGTEVRLVMAPPAPPAPQPAAPPVQQPAPPAPAPGGGATALCNDGSLSFAAHHQGACSHHGGVAVFYR